MAQLLLPLLGTALEALADSLTSSPAVAAIALCCFSMAQVSNAF